MEAATPFLKAMGKKIWHCGGPSTGHAAKVMPHNADHTTPLRELSACFPSGSITLFLQIEDYKHSCRFSV